jgi:hypothetical protein
MSGEHGRAIMRKAITTEEMVLLKEASEMFNETGCVPGFDGEQVPAEKNGAGCEGRLISSSPSVGPR